MAEFSDRRSRSWTGFVRLSLLACLMSIFGLQGQSALAEEDRIIDLRLFGKKVIGDYQGCHLAFWQQNRDPLKDRFAYVFYAPFNDGEELPAWMQVGKTIYDLTRQDDAIVPEQRLEPLRLYRTSKGTYSVLVEIRDQHASGSDIIVDKAKLTIFRSKHDPFVISVKGEFQCPQEGAEDGMSSSGTPVNDREGRPIRVGRRVDFDSLSGVPSGVLAAVRRDAPDCSVGETAGLGASYAVSDAMTLWEVPCNLYARTGSSVYVTSLDSNPDYSNVLYLPEIPDHGDSYGRYELRNPQMDPGTGIVRSYLYDGDGSCGSFEAYELRAIEGEALEFFLLEYREKPVCDGVGGDAESFPLIYSSP
ncbi:hypothetical protein [uncultured Cohaesibacter sp.]|uniref:hypothetical protein n=1 Tax=uncultured Cohaesibacter sp. TaxID=1002546 RepID=UPI0029309237|nr:hypothetical protein [uncultured Cohaesibacter sp.]